MKLRTLIALVIFGLGTLPLLTLVAINLRGHLALHEQMAIRQEKERARLEEMRLQATIRSIETRFALFAKSEPLRRALASSTPVTAGLEEHFRDWFSEKTGLGLQLIDRQGVLRSSLESADACRPFPETRLQSVPNADGFLPSLFVDPAGDDASCPPVFLLAEPVRSSAGELLGQALLSLPLTHLTGETGGFTLFSEKGTLLHRAPGFPDGGLALPARDLHFREHNSFLSTTDDAVITWLPLVFEHGERNLLWLGRTLDQSAGRKWKRELVVSILSIVSLLGVVVFLIGRRIALAADRIKLDIVSGLHRILKHEEEVVFTWKGPSELQALGDDLTDLGRSYAATSRARRRAEAELAASEEKFRRLAASAQDAIILLDPEGRISFWNQAATSLFGYQEQEALGRTVYDCIAPRLPVDDRLIEPKLRSAAGPIRETLELRAVTSAGLGVPIELSLAEAELDGRLHSIWIIRDLSERKAAEKATREQQEQLVQADKMVSLGMLVSGAAHEINNPNGITLLNAPLLARAWQDVVPVLDQYRRQHGDFPVAGLDYGEMRDEVPRLLREIEESGRRIRQIVADLKDYARREPAREVEPVDVNGTVTAALRLLANRLKHHDLHTRLAPDLPTVAGNRQRLEQVIVNLLQNSCEAMDEKKRSTAAPHGCLEISSCFDETSGQVLLTVVDQGVGIPPENLGKLTDPFFTTRRTTGGTGLGLSVSAGIVKEHGGSLRFCSQPGESTTVVLSLPALGKERKES